MAQQSQQLEKPYPQRRLKLTYSEYLTFKSLYVPSKPNSNAIFYSSFFFLSPYILRIPFNVVRQGPVVWIIQYTLKKKKKKNERNTVNMLFSLCSKCNST